MVRGDSSFDAGGGTGFDSGYGGGPRVNEGGYQAEADAIHQTEDLQDFKRRQEGHLILDHGRPLLVMSFGTMYQGQNPGKYKVEQKYHIPVGYKVIIKWEEDEIVFMTRKGSSGPEFQIFYLPKSPVSEDFTVFPWKANMGELWDQFLTVIEGKDDRDMRLFSQGPWRTFGVTRDEVQIALRQGRDERTLFDQVLLCRDNTTDSPQASEEEYMVYLGFDKAQDKNHAWIFAEFKNEPLPAHFFEYVRDGQVYWLNAQTQETTFKHPHYDKYQKMLYHARAQKPGNHEKAIIAFRIEFLLGQLFNQSLDDEDGQEPEPLVETVENVIEMARIFQIDIQDRPFLVHVLRRALRHYGHAIKEKRRVKDVDDFLFLLNRYDTLVAQYEDAMKVDIKKTKELKTCVQCDQEDATLFCNQCRDFFCQGCFDRLHARGRRAKHQQTWVDMGMCEECADEVALFHCVQCSDLYCKDCYYRWHARGGRRNHIPIILRSFNAQTDKLPDATPAMGTGNARIVKQANSPWFCFLDENNIKMYYNFKSGESRRDMPLHVINEPIEENKGGGMSAGWSGTWGANMFPDTLDEEMTMGGQTFGMDSTT